MIFVVVQSDDTSFGEKARCVGACAVGSRRAVGLGARLGRRQITKARRARRSALWRRVIGERRRRMIGWRVEMAAPAGFERHVPVLLEEAVAALAPHSGGAYLDATFGAGGYSRALLAHPDTRVLALDRDPRAIRDGQALVEAAAGRLTLVEARFSELAAVAERTGFAPLDGVVADIGVSSMQFDEAERGFSFRNDGPLDMRMEGRGRSAADIIAQADDETLADILYHYGEERASRRIARAILRAREEKPIETTLALAAIIERAAPGRPGEIHPATRSFQALRIAVNDELGELVAALAAAERALKPGGRLAIVSFHSLEDRIVKQFLGERSGRGETRSRRLPGEPVPPPPTFLCEGRQPVTPSPGETIANPRARSAKLRFATRTDAPPRAIPEPLARLARLPERVEGRR
jgi:16S rRNA (cytosine1402-N4)-methyltransferase